MKAVMCKSFGPPENLVLEEVPDLKAGKGKVIVSVKACGVNYPDTLIIEGKYQIKPPFPFSPGGEVAGVVKEIGEGVTNLKPGMRVFGLTGHGGFAEEVEMDARGVFPMLPEMDFVTASAVTMTYGTSYYALHNRAQLKEGETLLVLGAAGGVGLTAVELGKKEFGARVIACASTDEKLELCKQYGADETINYSKEDLRERIKELTGGKGINVTYDPVGGDYTEVTFRRMARYGRHLILGFPAGYIPKIPTNLALLKDASLMGVFWGQFATKEPHKNAANFMKIIQGLNTGKLVPHIHGKYPLEKAAEALRQLTDRKVKGKVVLVTE